MSSYSHTLLPWLVFNAGVVFMLALDLGFFHKKAHLPSYAEALLWSFVWFIFALLFGGWIAFDQGLDCSLLFFTGYAIEKSLSLDNIMVFAIVFQTLKIPNQYQHRVLFWGIISALLLRLAMIWGGILLLQKFHFILYIFGGILFITGLKILYLGDRETDLKNTWAWKSMQKFFPLKDQLNGDKFSIKQNGKIYGTPLLAALILIEFSDVIFALDSIPAIFAITQDPFIIYTANVFAILGLRSLYFLLVNAMDDLRFLKKGLAAILCFVGLKMLGIVNIQTHHSLFVILIILGGTAVASYVVRKKDGV
ncbi:TerC/Alx family metal homeostasis membrane protein [Candidatus Finniella inopinata]|uniref:TerC/Alx family metal homeostasis membrane protein n=1 Tax=Candidatus Finniella inopinata TaxID=1696036 RepID=A0A4Q7DGF6_9PROT|nr:TerC/Alx family metal homeostasis membrane protein [Candidatus Finniella inopinata]RZI45742.1 TerC/Alx family metal homeostasis membrane protein [Candidatus Finniella inopinata]